MSYELVVCFIVQAAIEGGNFSFHLLLLDNIADIFEKCSVIT